ncbi:MAG: hypothetical protein FJ095_12025 [Deltaproteobacteria bacterium]|nr:hypothetical protein [Deltaproteobacteria bacterium]
MNWDDDEDEATHIFGGNDPALDASWQVNISDTETRTMTAVEIGVEFGRGNLDQNDTFVWREGMRDWLPLGNCGDLLPILNQYGSQASAPAAPPPPPARPPEPPRGATWQASPAPPTAAYPQPVVGGLFSLPPPAAPVARPVQPSMPFATPSALSAGQSPLRGPMPSNPAMQSGAFAHSAPQANPVQAAQHAAAIPAPSQKSSKGLVVGLVVVALLLVGGGAAAVFLTRPASGVASASATASETAAPVATTTAAATTEATAAATPPPPPPAEPSAVAAGTAAPAADAPADAKKGAKPDAVASVADKDSKKDAKDFKDPKDAKKDDPKDAKKESKGGGGEFNVDAARSALSSAAGAASGCGKPKGPTGRGRATVTFSPSGSVSSAQVDPPFAGTPVGSCAVAAFKGARVPPFTGSSQTVTKSFNVK